MRDAFIDVLKNLPIEKEAFYHDPGHGHPSNANPHCVIFSKMLLVNGEYVKRVFNKVADKNDIRTVGSAGQNNFQYNKVPWIVVQNKKETMKIPFGVYVVYLFCLSEGKIYISLNQGSKNKDLTGEDLDSYAAKCRSYLDAGSFSAAPITLIGPSDDYDNDTIKLLKAYENGNIFSKCYTLADLTAMKDESILVNDLNELLDIYKKYMSIKPSIISGVSLPPPVSSSSVSVSDLISGSYDYITSKGFVYKKDFLNNLYLCLKTKPFAILAGVSGTGKSRVARLFAESIGAGFKMIPVKPDWSDSTDLIGYKDLSGKFCPGPFYDAIKEASTNPDKPYIVCLDEMNLARVEYYLSDYLSVIESRKVDTKTGSIETDSIIALESCGATELIGIPDNLYIIGTVNMDETTFPFSLKVLDRANSIEFSDVDLCSFPSFVPGKLPVSAKNDFLKSNYIVLADALPDPAKEAFIKECCSFLEKINRHLAKNNMQFGYRIRDEIVFYLLNNLEYGLLDNDVALDLEVCQKILPRLKGSGKKTEIMLCGLIELLEDGVSWSIDYSSSSETIIDSIRNAFNAIPAPKFPTSVKKLIFMLQRLSEDEYTSYWF